MAPERLGKYEIRGTLGKGAMGTVYAAWDPIISRQVAVKTVRLPDADDIDAQEELARFKREAQAAGRLTHPNIVGIFDYGESDGLAYIVMEFVAGRTLKSVLDGDERMPVATVGRVMADLLAGLQYSHERGVVHRDIKPANVMLTDPEGPNQESRAKIADFGIARIESSNLTQAGTIMGTPAYMSPEQFMGQTVDARTDIYSSGVLLFQLLTGERPFEGSMATIMHKALNTQPPKPSELSVTAPAAMDAVVARAMARRPEDRFATAARFADAVRDALTSPAAPSALGGSLAEFDSEATVVHATARVRPAVVAEPVKRRSKAPLYASVGFIALVGAGAAAAWFAGAFTAAPRPQATTPPPIQVASGTDPAPVAVTPPTAPVSEGASTQTPPEPTQMAAVERQPEPRPNLTQVVPPATEPPPKRGAEIIPPAIAPTPGPAATSATGPAPGPAPGPALGPALGTIASASEAGQPGHVRSIGRGEPGADRGRVSLEPATVTPPPTAVTAPDRTVATAPPAPQPAPQGPNSSIAAPTQPAVAPAPSVVVAPVVAIAPAAPAVAVAPAGVIAPAAPAGAVAPAAAVPASAPASSPTPAGSAAAVVAEVGLSPEALRRAIGSAAQNTDCSALQGDVTRDGRLSVRGVIGAGRTSGLLQQFRDSAPTAQLDWAAREADGPYCGVLDLVHAYTRPFGSVTGGIEVGLKDGRLDLRADDPIEVSATTAGFPAYLQVDYFSSDGSVAHLRTAAQGSLTVPARSSQSFVAGEVAPPFGTDLIVAIASSTPLFAKGKVLPDNTEAYLRDLRAAIDTARQHRSELAAGVTAVHTGEK